MAAELEALGFLVGPPQPRQTISLTEYVAARLREEQESLPGSAAYVSPTGTEFIVCGEGGGVTKYRKVAEVSCAITDSLVRVGGPYISGRYVPFNEAPEGWYVAFHDG
jgi:hypothetical protein